MVCLLYLCVLKPQVNGEVPPISSKLASNMVKQLQLSGTCCGCDKGEGEICYGLLQFLNPAHMCTVQHRTRACHQSHLCTWRSVEYIASACYQMGLTVDASVLGRREPLEACV